MQNACVSAAFSMRRILLLMPAGLSTLRSSASLKAMMRLVPWLACATSVRYYTISLTWRSTSRLPRNVPLWCSPSANCRQVVRTQGRAVMRTQSILLITQDELTLAQMQSFLTDDIMVTLDFDSKDRVQRARATIEQILAG